MVIKDTNILNKADNTLENKIRLIIESILYRGLLLTRKHIKIRLF